MTTAQCPNCSAPLTAGAAFCEYCGSQLTDVTKNPVADEAPAVEQPPVTPLQESSPSVPTECSWCKTPVEAGQANCPECGTELIKDDNVKQLCLHCQTSITYSAEKAGEVIACPNCSKKIQLRGKREYNPEAPRNWN